MQKVSHLILLIFLGLGVTLFFTHKRNNKGNPFEWVEKAFSPSQSIETKEGLQAQFNREILQEIYRVVLLKEVIDPREFSQWANALNEGASIEGVYNGFTHSSFFRELEQSSLNTVTPEALRFFIYEVLQAQKQFPDLIHFTEQSGEPLAKPLSTDEMAEIHFSKKPDLNVSGEEELKKVFKKSSIFTLKRVLGDVFLLQAKKQSEVGLFSRWYSENVFRLNQLGVDFGVSLRNKIDMQFHQSWVENHPYDLAIWEVLNRVHRVLNALNKKTQ